MLTTEAQRLFDEGCVWLRGGITESDINGITNLPFPNANSNDGMPEELLLLAQPIIQSITSNISEHFACSFVEIEIWDDVDSGSKVWHNDRSLSDANLTVLIYCDDRVEGNTISVRGPLSMIDITPDKYDVVYVNQNEKFEHRASISKLPRRVIGLQYFCEELEWI